MKFKRLLLLGTLCASGVQDSEGALSGTFASIPQGSEVNLTTEGKSDWAHWGFHTNTSIDRKAGVPPLISDLALLDNTNGYAFMYQFSDNFNGYTWSDGYPTVGATNTPTGVWAYGIPAMNTGFQMSVPANTNRQILKVYVGAYAARGAFEATLSDGSGNYSDSSLFNMRNGPSGVYTLTYSADSPGQTLTVRWRLSSFNQPDGNVTMQAAAVSAPSANNPPFAALNSPRDDQNFTVGQSIQLQASAFDPDGTVSRVEFFDGAIKIGEASASPYTLDWPDATPGLHTLTARPVDEGDATRSSSPVEVFVSRTGGTLSGAFNIPGSGINLSAEGTLDWVHWGLLATNSVERKAGVTPRISNFLALGNDPIRRFTNGLTMFSWSDGVPVAEESGTRTGIFLTGYTNGFEIRVPAAVLPRRLKVYVGLYGAVGEFQAFLSDGSAPLFADLSLNSIYNDVEGVYTLDFVALVRGQTLIVRYRSQYLYDYQYGNVTLQAASLSGDPELILSSPMLDAGKIRFSFPTHAGKTYFVLWSATLDSGSWQPLTSVSGDGTTAIIWDDLLADSPRFYRVEVQ